VAFFGSLNFKRISRRRPAGGTGSARADGCSSTLKGEQISAKSDLPWLGENLG